MSWALPYFGGVHTFSPEGPVHGTEDQISSSSWWVAGNALYESTLAGCPRGLHCEHGYSARFGRTSRKGGLLDNLWKNDSSTNHPALLRGGGPPTLVVSVQYLRCIPQGCRLEARR